MCTQLGTISLRVMDSESKIRRAAKKAANLGYDLYSSQENHDTFISLPTGSGKSLCYFVLPSIFNDLRGTTSSIVVVVMNSGPCMFNTSVYILSFLCVKFLNGIILCVLVNLCLC